MSDIYLPPTARRELRRWLSGRERIKAINPLRYAEFTSERADSMTQHELMSLIDCTGYGLLDVLMGKEQA